MESKNTVNGEVSMMVSSDLDIVNAREKVKWLAGEVGFHGTDLTVLSTLISELVRKVVALHATGNVTIQTLDRGLKKGIAINVSEMSERLVGKRRPASDSRASDRVFYNQRLVTLAGMHVADEFEILPNGQEGIVVRVVKWL